MLVQVRHIRRAENSRADALAKLATTSQEDLSRLLLVEHLAEPFIDLNDEEVAPVMFEPSWMDPIWDYLCAELGIKNYYSSPAHPQSNGQAEVTIKTLKATLKTKLEDLKGKWVEYLPEVLWAYRTTRKSVTQETPFALAIGTKAVAPIEIGLKSPRNELASVEHNEEALRLNLDLLDEKRDLVQKRTEEYQRKTVRDYDQKVRPKTYKPGDLVLKKFLPARKNSTHGKLGANWEGPYIVSHVVRSGNYELQTGEGKVLSHSRNAEHLKRFYQ